MQADAQLALRTILSDQSTPALAVPDVLRAVAAFKPLDISELMRSQLRAEDAIVRATAAELLGHHTVAECHRRGTLPWGERKPSA